MYIPLAKRCGTGARPDTKYDLNQYILVLMHYLSVSNQSRLTPGITFFADCYFNELKPDPELTDGKKMFYFPVGLNNPNTRFST
jgi:hypothetical protein